VPLQATHSGTTFELPRAHYGELCHDDFTSR